MGIEIQKQVLQREPELQEVVKRIADAYQPLRIYLFGSKARGTADTESDYDLLVVVPDNAPPELRNSRLAHQKQWGVRVPVDVIVCTDEWFRSRATVITSLPATIIREGQLLYAA